MPLTQATSNVLAPDAALNNLNAGAAITFTKPVTISSLSGAAFGTGVTSALAQNINTTSGFITANGTVTLTNKTINGANNTITNVPISTGISGLGSGIAVFLATPTSANLAAAVSDETGTGALVFGTSPNLISPSIQNLIDESMDYQSLGRLSSRRISSNPPAAFFDDFLGNAVTDLNWEISANGGFESTVPNGATNVFGVMQITAAPNTFRQRILRAGPTIVDGTIIEGCFAVPNFDNMTISIGLQRPAAGFDVQVFANTSINSGQWTFANGVGSNSLIVAASPSNGDFITGKKYRVRIEYKSTTLVNINILEADAGLTNWTTVFSGDHTTLPQDRGDGVASHGTPKIGCSAGSSGSRSIIIDWFSYFNPLNIR
jgi:hypothetical protein